MNPEFAYGMWWATLASVGLFGWFLLRFLEPRGWAEWLSIGVVAAFLVALFSEMYGFPLTIYLLRGWAGEAYPALAPFSHRSGHLWAVALGGSAWAWGLVMAAGVAVQSVGYVLLAKGGRLVHGAQGRPVSEGVYAYVRHPQYTGLLLFVAGFLVQWPTLLTVAMAPVVAGAYYRLARSEERALLARFGGAYAAYAARTPMFLPPRSQWPEFLAAQPFSAVRP